MLLIVWLSLRAFLNDSRSLHLRKLVHMKGQGSMNVKHQNSQSEEFTEVLVSYFNERYKKQIDLAINLGVQPAVISYYLSGKRLPTPEHLCAICIDFKLPPHDQRKLFHLIDYLMPDSDGEGSDRDRIIRYYMDFCCNEPSLSLTALDAELVKRKITPLVTTLKKVKADNE